MYELVKLDESEEESEERSEEEAAERLDRMSILDAISQCDAFRHTIRYVDYTISCTSCVGFSHKT